MWQEIASQPDLNWHQLVQLVQFQSMVVFYSWIGEALKVVVLFLLAADVCFSFALLFVYNDFLNQKNVDGLTEETAVPIGPSSEDNPNETQGNDT